MLKIRLTVINLVMALNKFRCERLIKIEYTSLYPNKLNATLYQNRKSENVLQIVEIYYYFMFGSKFQFL